MVGCVTGPLAGLGPLTIPNQQRKPVPAGTGNSDVFQSSHLPTFFHILTTMILLWCQVSVLFLLHFLPQVVAHGVDNDVSVSRKCEFNASRSPLVVS